MPRLGSYVVEVHDLKGSLFAAPGGQRENLWREFFSDPSQWWDHRSEKVTEHQILSEFPCQWHYRSC
jgi:hypothetical protein